jgi:DnaJ homolog subfamily C member 17
MNLGRKFHELTQAYELLLDPLRRMALDAKQRLKEAQQRRYAASNDKRKHMLEELERREAEFKKVKVEQQKKQQDIYRENEALMEQGRRLREQKEKELLQREEEVRKAAEPAVDEPPSLGTFPGDTCLSPHCLFITIQVPLIQLSDSNTLPQPYLT